MTINLDPEVVRKARELGLNISRIAENALKEYIERLESSDYKNNVSSNSFGDKIFRVVDGAGFEPATSAMPTPRSFQADLPAQVKYQLEISYKPFLLTFPMFMRLR